jgi:SAM-dependent methyltransferase
MREKEKADTVWKSETAARNFLEGTRKAIPYAAEQIDVMENVINKAHGGVTRFMDLGCGSGVLGLAIHDRWPDAQGVYVDFSDPMISVAKQLVGPHATLITGDFGDPSWVNLVSDLGPFDLIVSGFAIHHQEDDRKRGVYQEVYDLLVPGGLFLNLEHVKPASDWTHSLFIDQVNENVFQMYQATGADKTYDQVAAEQEARAHPNVLVTVEEQMHWLGEIGFVDVDCFFRIYELALFGGRVSPSRS